MLPNEIMLCSSSPRRQLLLRELGIHFVLIKNDIDEIFPQELKGKEVAIYIAEKKAQALGAQFKDEIVYVTADTIVWLNDEVLGKPVDPMDALNMLKKLSGKTHQVFTAVCLNSLTKKIIICAESRVQFNELSMGEIMNYIEQFMPFDKAGSYGAQECLPVGVNPCSIEEKHFLISINKPYLFERTQTKNQKQVPIIKQIDGSYFNVMGLPLVEVYRELERWR